MTTLLATGAALVLSLTSTKMYDATAKQRARHIAAPPRPLGAVSTL